MNYPKKISLDEYYDLPVCEIKDRIDKDGFKYTEKLYSKPEVGKLYRNPNVLPTNSRNVNLTLIIGVVKEKVPNFRYGFPPVIKEIHIQECRVYVEKEN